MFEEKTTKQLILIHLVFILLASVVFLWVIPLMNYLIPLPFALIFYIWYKLTKKKSGTTGRAHHFRSF